MEIVKSISGIKVCIELNSDIIQKKYLGRVTSHIIIDIHKFTMHVFANNYCYYYYFFCISLHFIFASTRLLILRNVFMLQSSFLVQSQRCLKVHVTGLPLIRLLEQLQYVQTITVFSSTICLMTVKLRRSDYCLYIMHNVAA